MKTALPNATVEQKERFRIIKEELGCIACWLDTGYYNPCNVHHLLDTGSRRGHDFTIGLCEFEEPGAPNHHVGNDMSIHRTKREFTKKYGTDDELLDLTNALIMIYKKERERYET